MPLFAGGVPFRHDPNLIAVNKLRHISWKRADQATKGDFVVDVGGHNRLLLQRGGHVLGNCPYGLAVVEPDAEPVYKVINQVGAESTVGVSVK